MARGKFNKRGGGPRLDAQNAEEIEIRNRQLAELEENRAQRRADDSDDEEGEDEVAKDKKEGLKEITEDVAKPVEQKKKAVVAANAPTAPVTTQADHQRNMAKLAQVRKRREEAEARRQEQEDMEKQQEEERQRMAAMTTQDDDEEEEKKSKKSSSKKKKEVEIPKLDKVTIKRMKPAQLKEALKERQLDIQGNAKTLLERLTKYETER